MNYECVLAFVGAVATLCFLTATETGAGGAARSDAQCGRPYQVALPLSPLTAAPPAEARRLGLSGDVFVAVQIDDRGVPHDVTVVSWNDPLFTQPARDAALAARYQPRVVDCVATPTTVTALVRIPVTPVPERVDVARFFPGTWRCGPDTETWRAIAGGVERHRPGFEDIVERFVRGPDAGWTITRNGRFAARAHPWVDEIWTFISADAAEPYLKQYSIVGPNRFFRTSAKPRDLVEQICTRNGAVHAR